MAKNKKKSLKLQNFIPWGQLLTPKLLCVSVILVQIMIHSHSFHVNEADNRILRTPISLKMHKKCPKQEKKITFASKLIPQFRAPKGDQNTPMKS